MKKQITKTKIVEIKISTDGHNGQNPYFSITGRRLDIQANGHLGESVSGCIHDEILKVAPELKSLVTLHLSSLDGVPMHAFENGFYWLAKAAGIKQRYEPEQSEEECGNILLGHLRTNYPDCVDIINKVSVAYENGKAKITTSEIVTEKCRQMQHEQGVFDAKVVFRKIVEDMKPRWKKQAEEALDLIAKL